RTRIASTHSARGCASLGTSRGKTLSSSGGLQRKNLIAYALAAELVRLKGDGIVKPCPTPTRPAKAATAPVPIGLEQDPDPVGNGFVASLARPGGNITGLSTLAPEISGKQLELLKETLPKISRVAVLGTSTAPGQALHLREIGLAAGPLSVQLQSLDVL